MLRSVAMLIVLLAGLSDRSYAQSDVAATIVALERGAMDRWAKGDPSGFTELMAPDVTVFDAFTGERVDGLEAALRHYAPFRGRVSIPRYEFTNPLVQSIGDTAILTYNFVAYGAMNEVLSRWNFTEVYRRTGDRWLIAQSHASYTLGQPPAPR